jgi:ubiquinone/menaquinone biosynthesis C-methylase UbiE
MRLRRRRDGGLAPGTAAYDDHVRAEIEHYTRQFESGRARQALVTDVPQAWVEAENRATSLVVAQTGGHLYQHILGRLGPGSRVLSLGCGAGGNEITIAQSVPDLELVGLDINPDVLRLGRERAGELGLSVTFEEADLNTVVLPRQEFDLVVCIASLHHVLELEHVTDQAKRCLRPGGALVSVDVITDNGYRMWPETRAVVRPIFATLPARFRLNHTAYGEPRLDEEIWEQDTSELGMECIRSADIMPVLEQAFAVEHFVPYFTISRRFLDTMYGPNYELDEPLDLALLNWIWELDCHYLRTGLLRPETFFGVFRPR